MTLLYISLLLYLLAQTLLKIYRKDCDNMLNFPVIYHGLSCSSLFGEALFSFQRNAFVRQKIPGERRKSEFVACAWYKDAISKVIPLELPHALSWHPGVAQHPCVSSVRLCNNNIGSGLLYPYLFRKSLCRELLLAGKVSALFMRMRSLRINHWLWWYLMLPLCKRENCPTAISIVFKQIG